MSVFAIADLHLSMGENVEKPMDMFGGIWDNHPEKLKNNWLKMIGPDDTVIIPGDISWALHLEDAVPDLMWLDALPGTKVIVRGNHDLWWSSMAKMRKIAPTVKFVQNDAYAGDGFIVCGSRGWLCPGSNDFTKDDEKIYNRELLRMDLVETAVSLLMKEAHDRGEDPVLIGAMHYPPTNDRKQSSGFTEAFSRMGAKLVVYGHLHGEQGFYKGPCGMINGVEYRLCSLDKLECVPMKIL